MFKEVIIFCCIVAKAFGDPISQTSIEVFDSSDEIQPLTDIVTVGNKTFVAFKTPARSWENASGYCKSQNMTLASIASPEEFEGLKDNHTNFYDPFASYWTSGRINNLEARHFSWNETNEELNSEYLEYRHYDNSPLLCIWFSPNGGDSFVRPYLCSQPAGTLCEKNNATVETDSFLLPMNF